MDFSYLDLLFEFSWFLVNVRPYFKWIGIIDIHVMDYGFCLTSQTYVNRMEWLWLMV